MYQFEYFLYHVRTFGHDRNSYSIDALNNHDDLLSNMALTVEKVAKYLAMPITRRKQRTKGEEDDLFNIAKQQALKIRSDSQ